MEYTLQIILGLFTVVVALGLVAKKLQIPYPIALVIGGLILSFIPGIPSVELDPDLIFLTMLPPLLFSGGYFTSVGAFKTNIGPIALLAVGLVIITTVAVAIFTHIFDALPWAVAFALGAIISPPDTIAATAITSRLKVHHHVVTILDGESLVNDASALVIYRMAIAAIITGYFSLAEASIEFVAVCAGGIAVGLLLGWISIQILKHLTEPSLCITVSFILPYLSYLTADGFHMSGVLAAVTSGIYVGWQLPLILSPIIRLETSAVWRMFVFLLNGAAFILIGLQLPIVLSELKGYSITTLIIYALSLNIVLILVRFIWVYLSIYLPDAIKEGWQQKHPYLDWKNTLIISWCGMRGVVSLAAALAIPILINGERFQYRNIIIFLTFSVIFVTLVLQGLTLPVLIRRLKLTSTGDDLLEEATIRMKTSQAAIDRLKEFAKDSDLADDIIHQMQIKYEDKIQWASSVLSQSLAPELTSKRKHTKEIQLQLLEVEREKIIQLRNKGLISGQVARRILNDLDLEAARLHQIGDKP